MNILGFFIAGSGKAGYVKKDIIMQEMKCSWEEATEYYKEINISIIIKKKQKKKKNRFTSAAVMMVQLQGYCLNVKANDVL